MSITRAGVQPQPQGTVSYLNPNFQVMGLSGGGATAVTNPAGLAAAFGAPNYFILPLCPCPTDTWIAVAAN